MIATMILLSICLIILIFILLKKDKKNDDYLIHKTGNDFIIYKQLADNYFELIVLEDVKLSKAGY